MASKKITRPFTLVFGLLLLFFGLFNFLDAVDFNRTFIRSNILLIVAGAVLVLIALAKR
jgi:hypothetical protein